MTKLRLLKRLKEDEIPLEPCEKCGTPHAKRNLEGCHNCQKSITESDIIEFSFCNEPHQSCSRKCVHDFIDMRLDDLLGEDRDTNMRECEDCGKSMARYTDREYRCTNHNCESFGKPIKFG